MATSALRLVPSAAAVAAFLVLLLAGLEPTSAARFTCNASGRATCQSLVGYSPLNATTLAAVKSLFQVRSLRALLAANSLPLSTPGTFPVLPPPAPALRVRLPCACSAGAGVSFGRPVYAVRAGDGLDAIARGAFGGLVTFQEIAAVNNISDPNKIAVGQRLRIALPCSCDPEGTNTVVHYAHVVAAGSSLVSIAGEFGVSQEALMRRNEITDAKNLTAGQVLDVPLRACSSSISSTATDRSLRIPNGSYVMTAGNCVTCSCSSASWLLDCQLTQGISGASACPAPKCGDLYLGNSSSSASCEKTTCSYAGYTNSSSSLTILTNLTTQSLCTGGSLPPTKQPSARSSALMLEKLQRPTWIVAATLVNLALMRL